jgi:PPOX class probable F420-dependent enzyme
MTTDAATGPEIHQRSGKRQLARLTAQETSRFLDAPRTMIVSTIGPGGWPRQAAVFYVMDPAGPVFWSYAKAQKVRNLRRDPRISCLVEEGTDLAELRGVQLIGRAEVSFDRDVVEATWCRLTVHHQGDITTERRAAFERQAAKRCVISVTTERVITWDHSKLGAAGR